MDIDHLSVLYPPPFLNITMNQYFPTSFGSFQFLPWLVTGCTSQDDALPLPFELHLSLVLDMHIGVSWCIIRPLSIHFLHIIFQMVGHSRF